MQCGEMKHKIDICVLKEKDGPFGTCEYVDFISNIWAKKEQLVGSQLVQAMGEGSKIPCNFIIRRNDKVTNKMFVRCDDVMYDIKSACPINKNYGYTILTCFELES